MRPLLPLLRQACTTPAVAMTKAAVCVWLATVVTSEGHSEFGYSETLLTNCRCRLHSDELHRTELEWLDSDCIIRCHSIGNQVLQILEHHQQSSAQGKASPVHSRYLSVVGSRYMQYGSTH